MQIIAVDDEHLALRDLLEVLGDAVPDAHLHGFSRAGEALACARETPVDVAFLDIEMADMNGLHLAKRLKDIREKTNIVFVTGYSQYALDAFELFASGYLLKPFTKKEVARVMEHLWFPVARPDGPGLRVQTFGNFEVFSHGEPLRFSRSKAKELFAYLVHKRGTGCSTRELAAILFEDRPYTLSLQKQVQTALSSMMQTLRAAHAQDCILRSYNRTAVDPSKIDCDYYRFLNWDVSAVNSYMGEYMSNYAWAEFVIDYLDRRLT